jgi:cytochrome c peroxidase
MAEQIFDKYKTEYESLFGALPPLDDVTRFPPLSAARTGCIPQNRTNPTPICDGPFHGMPGDQAEFDGMTRADQIAVTMVVANAGKAIAAYERRLSCGPTAFDAWLRGDEALSAAAQRGAALFVGKGECVSCHSGPFLSDQRFHNVGLAPALVQQDFIDANDRGAATGIVQLRASPLSSAGSFSDGSDGRIPPAPTAAMEGAFRTPILRCVSQRPTFMHTGQLRTLPEVVAFFDRGGDPAGAYPGTSELHPLGLYPQDESDLAAFLNALDGPGPTAALKGAP